MQAIILITVFTAAYLVLLIRYKKATQKGAKGLPETLVRNRSLYGLNCRTLSTIPLMLLSVMVCIFVSNKTLLRPSFASWKLSEIILLSCLCILVSVVSGLTVSTRRYCRVNRKEKITYFSIRIPGLIVYEFFFRGVLLSVTMQFFSAPVSIAFNIVLYAFAHVFCVRKEFLGSILFGFALCYTALINQSVYPCVLMHLSIALPYETIVLNNYKLKNTGL